VRRWLARVPAPLSFEQASGWCAALGRVWRQGYWVRLGGPTQQEFDARIARLSGIADSRRRRSVFRELFGPELTDEYGQPELAPHAEYEVRAMSAPVFGLAVS
jgi:hypothetical protein